MHKKQGLLQDITEEAIEDALISVKQNRAPGLFVLSRNMLKYGRKVELKPMIRSFKNNMATEEYPVNGGIPYYTDILINVKEILFNTTITEV